MLAHVLALVLWLDVARASPVGEYRHLRVESLLGVAADLPPLYRDESAYFGHLDVFFAPGRAESPAYLDAEYFVRRANGAWVTVYTGYREITLVDAAIYNRSLAATVRLNHDYAQASNAGMVDVREPYFAEAAVVMLVHGEDQNFSQKISLAIPTERFVEPGEAFYLQVRLKHFEGEGDRFADARRFIDGHARVSRLTPDDERVIERLNHLSLGCGQSLAN